MLGALLFSGKRTLQHVDGRNEKHLPDFFPAMVKSRSGELARDTRSL
jgi:hypothetical protein